MCTGTRSTRRSRTGRATCGCPRWRGSRAPLAHRGSAPQIGNRCLLRRVPMPAVHTSAAPAGPARKPRDDEIDVYGLTHTGKVRNENQDHFLICALKKQMAVYQTSLPQTDHLL